MYDFRKLLEITDLTMNHASMVVAKVFLDMQQICGLRSPEI